jgi:hypothetical protein
MSNQSTLSGDWLTVSQAASALGVSERTVRRRCEAGGLAARLEAGDSGTGGRVWRISPDAVAARPVGQRAASRTDGQAAKNQKQETTARPQFDRAASRPEAGGQTDGQSTLSALIAEKDARIDDLRGQLDAATTRENAARLQIEAANRATAEAHSALREALKMSNRALPEAQSTLESVSSAPAESRAMAAGEAQSTLMSKEAGQPMSGPQIEAERQSEPAQSTLKGRDGSGFRGWLLRLLMKG